MWTGLYYVSLILIIFPDGGRFLPTSEGLVIKRVKEGDAGLFTCRATALATGEMEERDIELQVMSSCWDKGEDDTIKNNEAFLDSGASRVGF